MRTLTAILAPVIFCVGFLSSGLSIICATELTSDVFYKREQVQEIRLTISKTNLYNMKKALPERIYVPATLHWRTFRMENIAVRYKGNSSSQPHQRHKRSYLIKVNEYNKGTRFLGFRRIALDNGVQFGSLFSEPIVTDILRDLDVPVSRCNYAKLFINDDYQGVYVNVERIDESFLEFHFGSKKGPLYKVHMPGPGANFAYAGDDAQQYKKGFEAKTKIAEHSFDDLIDLIRNIDQGDKSNYEKILDKHIML
jgi:spore coat protein CotH